MIYLDANATTPPLEEVVAAMAEAAREAWGNPASLHAVGRAARDRVERAREALAALLERDPRDVVLTSGATEANNLGLLRPFADPAGGTLVTSRLEHPSVVRVAEALAERGVRVVWLPVGPEGRIDPDDVGRALAGADASRARLVAVQAVNHETGVVQPIAAIAEVAHAGGAHLHVDAVQAIGRLPASCWAGADTLAFAAHKIRGPKGVGALASRPGLAPRPLLRGGAQERGLRPGTVDPVAAAGLEVAARWAASGPERHARLAALRDALAAGWGEAAARAGIALARNGGEPCAAHVLNVSVAGWAGDELAASLDLEGVCVSAGSACAAGTPEPSPVVTAMLGVERARSAIRASLGEWSTPAEVAAAIAAFGRVVARATYDSAAS